MRATLSAVTPARSRVLELPDSILGTLNVVLGHLNGEVGLEGILISHLLFDPGLVRYLGETPDELVAREFVSHASILGL